MVVISEKPYNYSLNDKCKVYNNWCAAYKMFLNNEKTMDFIVILGQSSDMLSVTFHIFIV